MNLSPDMSLTEALSVVAGGTVTYECRDAGDHINLWTDSTTGVRVTPWCRAGQRLDLALYRDLLTLDRDRRVFLTPLGRRRLDQLRARPRTMINSGRVPTARQPADGCHAD